MAEVIGIERWRTGEGRGRGLRRDMDLYRIASQKVSFCHRFQQGVRSPYPYSEFCETPSSATRHQSGLHKQTRSLGSKHGYYIVKSEISRWLESCRERIRIETLRNGACETKKTKRKEKKGGKDSIAGPNEAEASICKLSSVTGLVRIVSTIAI